MSEQQELAIDKTPQPSVADSIREALKESAPASDPGEGASAETPAAAPGDAPEGSSTRDERPRGPDGKFAAKPKQDGLGFKASEPATKLEAPQHWPDEDKQWFAGLADDTARQKWLDKVKSLEGGYQEKFKTVADWVKAVEPYTDYIKGFGTTPHQAVAYLMNSERILRYGSPEQKMQMLQTLAQDYQIPLPNGAPSPQPNARPAPAEAEQHWDPTVQALQQQLGQLTQQLNSRAEQEQHAEKQRVVAEIVDFQNAKTEAGQPANPYFAEVADEIALLAHAERQAGRKPILKDLYEKAVWANPVTRQKAIADRDREAEARRQADAKARVQQARTAGSSVSGAPIGGGASDVPANSVREEVARNMARARGRV